MKKDSEKMEELAKLLEKDEFYGNLDNDVENIETQLKDGVKRTHLEWEIELLKDDIRLLRPSQRIEFKLYVIGKYPKTARLMGWKVCTGK